MPQFEWAVLVTNLEEPIETVAQLYRERGDCENTFDELKNQWGWSGFTTQDIKRSSIMARLIALVYNWWNIFCRLAEPEKAHGGADIASGAAKRDRKTRQPWRQATYPPHRGRRASGQGQRRLR